MSEISHAIGARIVVTERDLREPRIDIPPDRTAEFFALRLPIDAAVSAAVIDACTRDRHLLLMVRAGDRKATFLCGMDEALVRRSRPGAGSRCQRCRQSDGVSSGRSGPASRRTFQAR